MNLEEIKYDAFISYRHCDLDQYVAVTLHKELEAFRLPKYLQKALSKKGITKKKIERVFRDRDELPITNNLADPITNALRNSEYLLVICTPRLPESIWCKTEVETFIKMHGREKVFAVLAEGEPAESFPEALLYEEKEIEDENGNKVVKKVPVEPLAADVRGADKKEVRKKIKEEVLRLAAPMFDCSYDDLKQRHREQKIRRILTASACATAIFGAFAVVSTTMALRIHKQSGQIKEQAAKIEEQYTEALKVNAKGMADDALELVERGDRKGAVELAYNALTGTEEEPMPYTAEAEYALSQALGVYEDGSLILPVDLVDIESDISWISTSADASRILVGDTYGNLYVYEPDTEKMLTETPIKGLDAYADEDEATFLDNSKIAYAVEDGFAIYDLDTKEEKTYDFENVNALKVAYNSTYLMVKSSHKIAIYDYSDMTLVHAIEDNRFLHDIVISADGQFAAYCYSQDEEYGVVILDITSGNSSETKTFLQSVCAMYFYDESLYVATYSSDITEAYGEVICYNIAGDVKWRIETGGGVVDKFTTFGVGQRDKLVYNTYDTVTVVSTQSGEVISETTIGDEVVNFTAYNESNRICYMTRDGKFHALMADQNVDYNMENVFYPNSGNISDFCFGNGFFVSASYYDTAFAVYRYSSGNNVELCAELESTSIAKESNNEGTLMALDLTGDSYKTFGVIDLETGNLLFEKEEEGIICDKYFNQDGNLMVLSDEYLVTYDARTGEELNRLEYTLNEESVALSSGGEILANGSLFYAFSREGLYIKDASTGEVKYVIENDAFNDSINKTFDISNDGLHYAYGNSEKDSLIIGSFGENNEVKVSENFKFVSGVSYLNGIVFVTKENGHVTAYSAENGEIVKEYTTFTCRIKDAVDMNGKIILAGSGQAYILNEDLDVIGGVEGYASYSGQKDCFYVSSYQDIFTVPRYTLDMLLEEAKENMQ